jgi:signal transduction histidine kinase
MRQSQQDALDRWLAAEREGRDGEAEAALLELFEALPLAAPAAGFADRVLVRAGLQAAAMPADLFAWRPLRIALGLALAAIGFGVLWLPPLLRFLVGLWSVGGAVQGGIRMLADASQLLVLALRIWDFLLTIVHALAQPLAVLQVRAILMLALLASSLAFRFLRDQITGERNWTYVDPS